MYKRKIFSYELKAKTEKQLNEMYDLLNYENYTSPRFTHYFHVWVKDGTGLYWFPKEKYYGGTTPYAIALIHYADYKLRDIVYESEYVKYEEYSN